MALSRIRCGMDPLPTVLSRFNLSVNGTAIQSSHHQRQDGVGEFGITKSGSNGMISHGRAHLHVSGVRRYPAAPRLALPSNVSEIFGNETGRFTPERSRDIAAPVLAYVTRCPGGLEQRARQAVEASCRGWEVTGRSDNCAGDDGHVGSYDCFGAVSLNSSMQTNVPSPYCSSGRASHFNMPGGQWAKDCKYIAEDLQRSHYARVKAPRYRDKKNGRDNDGPVLTNAATARLTPLRVVSRVEFSTDSKPTGARATDNAIDESGRPVDDGATKAPVPLTNAEKLKKAVKDYGSTVVVFHVGISLISLGVCYVAVSSGLDLGSLVKTMSNGGNERFENAIAGSSSFLVAYAVHKLFAPVRISITLGATPFVVRYLRRVGILKMPKAR